MNYKELFGFITIWIHLEIASSQPPNMELQLKPNKPFFAKNVNTSIVFTCELVGEDKGEDVKISWAHANTKISSEKSGRKYIEEAGRDGQKLYINNIETGDGGTYKCSAEVQGHVFEKSIELEVINEITFDSAVLHQYPAIHTDALVVCIVSGSPKPEISWKKNGMKIDGKSAHYALHEKGLLIRNVTSEDNGEYTCRAEVESEGRYDERKISVEVHTPPKISEGPGTVEGVEGDAIQMACMAHGFPAPAFKFFRAGKPDMEITSDDRHTVDGVRGRVDFRPLNKSDEGEYVCSVANDVGSDEAKGHIKVLVKPKVFDFKEMMQVAGQPATLDCRARGDPAPIITFAKLAASAPYQLGDNENGSIVVISSAANHMQLFIKSATPSHAGKYRCKAVNSIGEDQAETKLTVKYPPKFQPTVREMVYIWAGKTKNVSCDATGEPEPSFEWFRNNQPISSNSTFFQHNGDFQSKLQISVREIDQAWIYGKIHCKATNELASANIQIEIKRATTPDVPKSVEIKEKHPNGFILRIEEPMEDGGEPVSSYHVEYIQRDSLIQNMEISENASSKAGPSYSSNVATTELINKNELRVENLKPSTPYVLYVRAVNEVGLGRPVEIKATTEDIRKPYPVKIISEKEGDAFSYHLKWDKINTGGLPLSSIEIRYREVKEEDEKDSFSDWTTIFRQAIKEEPMQEILLENLNPKSNYQVEARSKNEIDWSEYNPIFTFQTREATPLDYNQKYQPAMGGGAIVGIIIISILLMLIIVDLALLFLCRCGITHSFLTKILNKNSSASDKEKALEEGEKEHLKLADETTKPKIVLELEKDNQKGPNTA